MTVQGKFVESIKAGYSFKGESVKIGTAMLECVTNEKNASSSQCCIKDGGRPLIYALREEYINRFMVL